MNHKQTKLAIALFTILFVGNAASLQAGIPIQIRENSLTNPNQYVLPTAMEEAIPTGVSANFTEPGITKVQATSTFHSDLSVHKKYNKVEELDLPQPYAENSKPKVHIFEIPNGEKDFVSANYPTVDVRSKRSGMTNGHAALVIRSFGDIDKSFKYEGADEKTKFEAIPVYLWDSNDGDANASVRGILNMSYGSSDGVDFMSSIGKDSAYMDKIDPQKVIWNQQMFSKVITDSKYVKNNQLRVIALGNNANDRNFFTNSANFSYHIMAPEMQKAARNDVIMVKNVLEESTFIPQATHGWWYGYDGQYNKRKIYEARTSQGVKKYYEFQEKSDGSRSDSKPLTLRAYTVAYDGMMEDQWGSCLLLQG